MLLKHELSASIVSNLPQLDITQNNLINQTQNEYVFRSLGSTEPQYSRTGDCIDIRAVDSLLVYSSSETTLPTITSWVSRQLPGQGVGQGLDPGLRVSGQRP